MHKLVDQQSKSTAVKYDQYFIDKKTTFQVCYQ